MTAEDVQVGKKVWVLSLGHEAEVVEAPDHKGRCRIRAGLMSAQVNMTDLRPRSFGKTQPKTPAAHRQRPAPEPETTTWANARPQTPDNTVDVRGQRADEAQQTVEAFLDRCFGLDKQIAFIIHGHGTGVLKKELRAWLRHSHYVREQRPGERGEGGDGVTAVLLS
jgi:DNA mismatch repair protein MutS2